MLRTRTLTIAVAIGLVVAACSGGSESSSDDETADEPAVVTTDAPAATAPATTAAPEPEADATTSPPTTAAPTTTEGVDTDGDGDPDASDPDDDDDGVADVDDAFPLDALRSAELQPLAPIVDGRPVLTDGPLLERLDWMLAEIAPGETTTVEEIEAAFDPDYLANFGAEAIVGFMDAVRTSWAGFGFTEVLTLHPGRIDAIIEHPNGVEGLFQLGVTFDGTARVNFIGVNNFEAGTLAPEYVALDVDATVAGLQEQADRISVLVARIEDDRCVSIIEDEADVPFETASMFKGYPLGAAAEAVHRGELALDTEIPIDPAVTNANGSQLWVSPPGTPWTLLDHATLMMAISDNTSTDHVMTAVGRDAMIAAVERLGHSQPEALSPFLTTTELWHLIVSVPAAEAEAYASLPDDEQRAYADEVLVPLGGIPFDHFRNGSNNDVLSAAGWRATPIDLCTMMAGLRTYPDGSDALRLVDAAYGGGTIPAFVTRNWERSWFKGGSLGGAAGLRVLTLGYLMESDDRGTYVVIAMANDDEGPIDQPAFVSLTHRLLLAVEEADIT